MISPHQFYSGIKYILADFIDPLIQLLLGFFLCGVAWEKLLLNTNWDSQKRWRRKLKIVGPALVMISLITLTFTAVKTGLIDKAYVSLEETLWFSFEPLHARPLCLKLFSLF